MPVGTEARGMSGRGETPEEEIDADAIDLSFGEVLYNEEGDPVGTVRGMEASGVYVATRGGVEALSVEHARSGHDFGAAELVWRCMECGEMGHIRDDIPDGCPGCGGPREALMYWTED